MTATVRFAATQATVRRLEQLLSHERGIVSSVAYTSTGTPRFFLAFKAQLDQPNSASPLADVRLRASRLELGYPVQFRIMGPNPMELRRIAARVGRALATSPHLRNISDNWGAMGKRTTVTLDQDKARLLGISSADVATALQTLEQGATITEYREGTDLIPVIVRAIAPERHDLAGIGDITIPVFGGAPVPLAQIARIGWSLDQPVAWRRDRTPMLLVQADTTPGIQAPVATAEVLPSLVGIKASLPAGYRIETAGAVEEGAKGSASIAKVIPLMVQTQSFARMAMVLLTAPLGLVGATAALLLTGAPFGFVATLGLIALAGIIMRNGVILIDQIEQDIRAGSAPAEAIVLALVPLAFSVFWGPMAIAIMGGLVGATRLTLCFVPALYAAFSASRRIPQAAAAPAGLRMAE